MRTLVVNNDRLENEQDSVGDALLDGDYFTGVAFEVHEATGAVVGVSGYKYGKRHGPFRVWHRSGRLKEEEYVELGAFHGPTRRWHRDGQLAEFEHYERFILTRSKRWDESGKLINEYSLRDAATLAKLEHERKGRPRPVIDIDLTSFTFFERPEAWGQNESDLPAPQAAPSLELCRALEARSSSER